MKEIQNSGRAVCQFSMKNNVQQIRQLRMAEVVQVYWLVSVLFNTFLFYF